VIEVQEVPRQSRFTGDGSVHLICSAKVGDAVLHSFYTKAEH